MGPLQSHFGVVYELLDNIAATMGEGGFGLICCVKRVTPKISGFANKARHGHIIVFHWIRWSLAVVWVVSAFPFLPNTVAVSVWDARRLYSE